MMDKDLNVFSKAYDLPGGEVEVPAIDADEFRKVVHSRRSVRVFDGTPVPEAAMREILDIGLLAANSSNLQSWEFYWARSPEKKAAVVEACLSQPAAKTAAELVVCVARTETWKRSAKLMLKRFDEEEKSGKKVPAPVRSYYSHLVPLAYGQGPLGVMGLIKKIIVFFRGLSAPTPREPTSYSQMRTWAVKTTALACQNIMLAARALGYDSCPMEGCDSRRIAKILDLPSDAVFVMVISIGKRKIEGIYGPRIRFDKSLFVHEV